MMRNWTPDKEKKIMRNYRFTLTIRVVRVLVICFILYSLYMMAISLFFHSTHADRKHAYYTNVALEWQQPNVKGEHHSGLKFEVSPFLTQRLEYPLIKQVGKEDVVIGEMRVRKSLWNAFSSMDMDVSSDYTERRFYFYLPEQPKTGQVFTGNRTESVWRTLEKLPEGTVSEIAFSTTSFMKPEKLLKQLAAYDVEIVWMPLYTGEFIAFQPMGYSGGTTDISIHDVIGFSGGRQADDDDLSESSIGALNIDSNKTSQRWMLDNMKDLLTNERKSYYEQFLGLYFLQERYDYLKKHGFQVYGAVVTGPTKELLKLREVEGITHEQLGDTAFWNWE